MFAKVLAGFGAMCATAGLFAGVEVAARADVGLDTPELIARASQAHERLMRGDIEGYRRVMQVTPDFLLMDPFGGRPTGAPKSDAHWNRIGRIFRDGRAAVFEPIASYQSGDLAVIVATERAHVAVGSLPAQDWALRVTLVFRRDNGSWRLAHRHADPLAEGISLEQAGRLTRGARADDAP